MIQLYQLKMTNMDDDIEIIFENLEPTLDEKSTYGGAITENYENPSIKHNK